MPANHDLSLSHSLQTACEILAAGSESLKERLKSTLQHLSPVLNDIHIAQYRAELDEIHVPLQNIQQLTDEEAADTARKIVKLAFKVAADTEAGFQH